MKNAILHLMLFLGTPFLLLGIIYEFVHESFFAGREIFNMIVGKLNGEDEEDDEE